MRGAIAILAVSALLSSTDAGAEKKDKPKHGKGGPGGDVSVSLSFSTGQRDAAHGWYAETYGRGKCPPGLAKKNNGCLPPGQAKKRYAIGQPLPRGITWGTPAPELMRRVGHAPDGYMYVTLDGDLLKLAAGTLLVVDAISGLVD